MSFDRRREFCRRQALNLIAAAEAASDEETAEVLLTAARYWLDQLEAIERAERDTPPL